MPNFHDVSARKGFVMFNEGDLAEKVFIITDGEFIVTKRSIMNNKNVEQNFNEIMNDPQRYKVTQNKFFKKNI